MTDTITPSHTINPMRSAFTPLPVFTVVTTDAAGEMGIDWTDGVDALWEFQDICTEVDRGNYAGFQSVRIEFNGTVFREKVFASADL